MGEITIMFYYQYYHHKYIAAIIANNYEILNARNKIKGVIMIENIKGNKIFDEN